MVYVKEDGTTGWSWQLHLQWMKENHPDDIDGILEAHLEINNPKLGIEYQEYQDARDYDTFTERQQIAQDFIQEHNIQL